MANVIYRGPIAREPQTVNGLVAGTYLPGTVVSYDGTNLTEVADSLASLAGATAQRILILSNRRFYDQGPDTAYASGDTGVAYRAEGDQEYQGRFAAGTYARGDLLTVTAGQFTAAASGDVVVAYYDGAGATLTAGDRDDVVIATASFVAAA